MEQLNEWICSLAAYFLLMSVLNQLLPSQKYGKYIRLFGGMILILLILSPLSRGLHLEEKIARYYESFVFQYEAGDLKKQILGVEQLQLTEMIEQYENAIALDIRQMAGEEPVEVISCQVEICKEQENAQFGQVQSICLILGNGVLGERPGDERVPEYGSGKTEIEPVKPVSIGMETFAFESVSQQERNEEADDLFPDSDRQLLQSAAGRLRKKITTYYELEEEYVEIQIVERKG